MRTRILLSLVALPLIAQAQSVSLLNQGLNDAVRRAQLWGSVPATASSFCVRPVHATRALGFTDPYSFDAKFDFTQPGDDTLKALLPKYQYKDWLFVRATPILVRAQLNSHHDYGWQDGPMIPNKGMQTYLNGGIYGRLLKGLIEFQYAPELVSAENRDLSAPGVRNQATGSDIPDRFGTDPYRRSYTGQSYVKLNVDFLSVGLSTENVNWGPGYHAGLVMSENAPGMPHFTVESNKPLHTKWGSFEGQLVTGKMMASGYRWVTGPNPDGSSLPEVVRDPTRDSNFRVYTAICGVYNPIWLPGFSLGVTRAVWTETQPEEVGYSDYISLFFSNPFRGSGGGTQVGVDQMASAFVRYVMPESHSEVYGEYGFDDNRYDLEDLIVSPDHSRAYTIGFRKLTPVADREFWDFHYEITQIEMAKESFQRFRTIFYDTDYSHRGQNLGAGIGTGSNQWMFSLSKVRKGRRLGFVYERVARDNDILYRGAVPWVNTWYGFDFTKKYIESSLGLNYSERRGPVLYWVKALLTQTYNWNHWYDPAGTGSPMRANGYNLKSLNLFTGATVLL